MKITLILILTVLTLSIASHADEKSLQQYVQQACQEDKEKFCSNVTPGEGRLLACAAAHEDQLSGQCSHALYQAADILDAFIQTINYIAVECKQDITTYCSNVKLGEGRILTCLDDNSDKISGQCDTALARTVVKVEE